MDLWKKIFIGLALGLVLGITLNQTGYAEYAEKIKPLGDLFINGIKMLIVPLIFVSLVSGITSLKSMATMGRYSVKTIMWYLLTTAVAITIGLILGAIFQPGIGVDLGAAAAATAKEAPSLVSTIVAMVPVNPIASMAEGNILQVIVFAVFFGVSITLAGNAAKPVKDLMDGLAEVFYKLTNIIISFAPYGVFALITWV